MLLKSKKALQAEEASVLITKQIVHSYTCCALNAELSIPNNHRKIKDTKFYVVRQFCICPWDQSKIIILLTIIKVQYLSKKLISQNSNTFSTFTHT